MKIGVSGASGHLGRAVVSELLQRGGGHEVVAITRTPENVSGPAQGRFGDYNRPESLAEAYAGLDRLLIITTVDPEPGKRGAQIIAAIDAAVMAGVEHIVLMSAVGTRQEEEPARGASYWRGEQHLIATAPAWTILRMNFYSEAFVQLAQAALKQGVLTGLAENRAAFVARDDVAAAAAGILVGDGHAGAIYNATGPGRLSGAERAAVISEITGRSLAFRVITEEQLRAGLTQAGLPAGAVNIVVSIQASFAAGTFDIVTGDVEHLGGRPPKPLRDVLAGALKADIGVSDVEKQTAGAGEDAASVRINPEKLTGSDLLPWHRLNPRVLQTVVENIERSTGNRMLSSEAISTRQSR